MIMAQVVFKDSLHVMITRPNSSNNNHHINHYFRNMNSTNNTVAAMNVDNFIQETHEDYVYTLVIFSSTTLVLYATLINVSREKEHVWSRLFSLPTLLYIFARYGGLIIQGLTISTAFISLYSTFLKLGRSCNILTVIEHIIFLLTYIGVQGLLVIRAYSICQGNIILTSVLGFNFFSYCGLDLYQIITIHGCFPSINNGLIISEFAIDIIIVATDLLIFGICMWKVWGTWRLKGNNGIQSGSSLISVLLTQGILRCCFSVAISAINIPLTWLTDLFLTQCFAVIQNALSSTLVADFTLDLRELNSAKIEASQISLPPLQFSNVLQHIHQSFLVEMATPEERNLEEESGDNDHDNSIGYTDDIQAAEV